MPWLPLLLPALLRAMQARLTCALLSSHAFCRERQFCNGAVFCMRCRVGTVILQLCRLSWTVHSWILVLCMLSPRIIHSDVAVLVACPFLGGTSSWCCSARWLHRRVRRPAASLRCVLPLLLSVLHMLWLGCLLVLHVLWMHRESRFSLLASVLVPRAFCMLRLVGVTSCCSRWLLWCGLALLVARPQTTDLLLIWRACVLRPTCKHGIRHH